MAELSARDMQQAIDRMRASILQNLKELHGENQAIIRNSQARHDLLNQRVTIMERNLQSLVHDMARMLDMMTRMNQSVSPGQEVGGFTFQRI